MIIETMHVRALGRWETGEGVPHLIRMGKVSLKQWFKSEFLSKFKKSIN